jgi:serine/threonine-protein kinase
MALSPGTRLGPYEVLAKIGEGGMGEVYRARDKRLDRDVAIKVLPESLASDRDRIARFEREARTLAAFNHPHIAHIHGLEESSGLKALVMELVEGPTLADRIAQGALPVDEAIPVAKQIADALEAAHEQGIIHRDLKPANIKVRPDGAVKVLDFGLAKAMEGPSQGGHSAHDRSVRLQPDLTRSPTITTPAVTQAGFILGTAAYMSPEQARGRPVDKRTDMWAFGCVLYEMLTGARAFSGEDVGEVLAAVIKTEVDWNRLAHAPMPIQTLVRRCLRKDPRQRLGDAGAVRLELEDALREPDTTVGPSRRWSVVSLPLALVGGLIAAAAASAITVWLRPPAAPQAASSLARLTVSLPAGTELADGISVAISPDGTQVAYVASRGGIPQLYLRSLNDFEARPLADTDRAVAPFFSPDGKWLGFFADAKLKKVSTTGGVVVELADAAALYGPGGAWGPGDTIVYPSPDGLAEIAASGGTSRLLLTPQQRGSNALFPDFLPGGKTLLVSSSSGDNAEDRSIDLMTISTGERRVLVQRGVMPRYLPTGHLVFLRAGSLMAVPFDVERLEVVGTPVEVLTGIRQDFFGTFSCSRQGSCVYIPGGSPSQRRLTFVDRTGAPRPLPLPPNNYVNPRFAPSGNKLLFQMGGFRCDVNTYDMVGGTTTRLTSENDNHWPVWAPDGQRIAYISYQGGRSGYRVVARSSTGGGVEERLGPAEFTVSPVTPISLSRDSLVFADRGDLWSLSLSENSQPHPFAPSRFNETAPAFSPDGRWLAYVSDESGRLEVYVRPFPGPGEKTPISIGGGSEPVWDRRGRELFFRNGDQMMVVAVNTGPTFSAGRPRLLFTGPYVRTAGRINYDVSPDGENFVMLDSGEESGAATKVNVLLNWYEELKRRVP